MNFRTVFPFEAEPLRELLVEAGSFLFPKDLCILIASFFVFETFVGRRVSVEVQKMWFAARILQNHPRSVSVRMLRTVPPDTTFEIKKNCLFIRPKHVADDDYLNGTIIPIKDALSIKRLTKVQQLNFSKLQSLHLSERDSWDAIHVFPFAEDLKESVKYIFDN
jgi:hypothetical protein